eukprot:360341-Chlamydomonas_euryale.AAC.7
MSADRLHAAMRPSDFQLVATGSMQNKAACSKRQHVAKAAHNWAQDLDRSSMLRGAPRGKATTKLGYGDCLQISTPGAGGFGDPADNTLAEDGGSKKRKLADAQLTGGSVAEYQRRQEQA